MNFIKLKEQLSYFLITYSNLEYLKIDYQIIRPTIKPCQRQKQTKYPFSLSGTQLKHNLPSRLIPQIEFIFFSKSSTIIDKTLEFKSPVQQKTHINIAIMFDKEFEELLDQDLFLIKQANTTFTPNPFLHHTTHFSVSPVLLSADPMHSSVEPLDLSFDRQFYRNNALLIKRGVFDYLQYSIFKCISKDKHQQEQNLAHSPATAMTRSNYTDQQDLYTIIQGSNLLNQISKGKLWQHLQDNSELLGLMKEIVTVFSTCLAKEVLFLIYNILQTKIHAFQNLMEGQEHTQFTLPQMNRFYEDKQGQIHMVDAEWQDYGHVDKEVIEMLAQSDLEKISNKLFQCKQLKQLNLFFNKKHLKERINSVNNFTSLVEHISKTTFLTMSGNAQTEDSLTKLKDQLQTHSSNDETNVEGRLVKKVKLDQ